MFVLCLISTNTIFQIFSCGVQSVDISITKFVIEKGGNLSLRDNAGHTPLDIVVQVCFFLFIYFETSIIDLYFSRFLEKRSILSQNGSFVSIARRKSAGSHRGKRTQFT